MLLVNWGYYIFNDWQAAQFTVEQGASIADWMNAFATSLDELAWFSMLFLFELETYWLDKETMSRLTRFTIVAIRFASYSFLAHTVYAYSFNYLEFSDAALLPGIQHVCDLVDNDFTFLRNNAYTAIDAASCGSLSAASTLYQVGDNRIITDLAGLQEITFLSYIDIQDALVWLAVVLVIEMTVLLQERGISAGPLITGGNWLTVGLNAVLIMHAVIWAWKGHWVFAWDEVLWIGGFAAIELNLSEWRHDMLDEAAPA